MPDFTELGLNAESKALGGKIGQRIGGGLRAAPPGMSFVDVTGRVDADNDGIVFEGLPLERPIIPRFTVPTNLARSISKLTEGDALDIEKQRRAGNSQISFDENKLRSIVETVGGDSDSLGSANTRTRLSTRSVIQTLELEDLLDIEKDKQAEEMGQPFEALDDWLVEYLSNMGRNWTYDQAQRLGEQVNNLILNLRGMRDKWQSMGTTERSGILRRMKTVDGYEPHPLTNMSFDDIIRKAKLQIHDDGTLSFKLPPNPILRKLVPGDRDYQDVEVPDRETIRSIFDNLNKKSNARQWDELFESIYERAEGSARLAVFPAKGEELPHHSLYLPSYKRSLDTKFPGLSDVIKYRYNDIAARILQHYVGPELEKVKRNENPKIGQVANDNDHYIHGYLGLMADPHAWRELGQELDKRFEVSPSVILHDVLGHYANGNTFDRHGEWGNILATIALARDKEFWEKLRQIPELADLTDEDREIFIRGLLADVAANWLQRIGYPVGGSFRLGDIKDKINFYDGPIDELLDKLDPPSTRSRSGTRSMRKTPLGNVSDEQLIEIGKQSIDGMAIREIRINPTEGRESRSLSGSGSTSSSGDAPGTRSKVVSQWLDVTSYESFGESGRELGSTFGRTDLEKLQKVLQDEQSALSKTIDEWQKTGVWNGETNGVAMPRVYNPKKGITTNLSVEELEPYKDEMGSRFNNYLSQVEKQLQHVNDRLANLDRMENDGDIAHVNAVSILDLPNLKDLAERGKKIRTSRGADREWSLTEADPDATWLVHTGVPILENDVLDPSFTLPKGGDGTYMRQSMDTQRLNGYTRNSIISRYEEAERNFNAYQLALKEYDETGVWDGPKLAKNTRVPDRDRGRKEYQTYVEGQDDAKINPEYLRNIARGYIDDGQRVMARYEYAYPLAKAGKEHLSYSHASFGPSRGYVRNDFPTSKTYLVRIPNEEIVEGFPSQEFQIFEARTPIASFEVPNQFNLPNMTEAEDASIALFEEAAQKHISSNRLVSSTRSSRSNLSLRSRFEPTEAMREKTKRASERYEAVLRWKEQHAEDMLELNSELAGVIAQAKAAVQDVDKSKLKKIFGSLMPESEVEELVSNLARRFDLLNKSLRENRRPLYGLFDSSTSGVLLNILQNFVPESPERDRTIKQLKKVIADRSKSSRPRLGGEERILANDFISPDEFIDSGWWGAWLYPDGRIYPVEGHQNEHEHEDAFDDGLVRLVFNPDGGLTVVSTGASDDQLNVLVQLATLSRGKELHLFHEGNEAIKDFGPEAITSGELDLFSKPTPGKIKKFLKTLDFSKTPEFIPTWLRKEKPDGTDTPLLSTRSRTRTTRAVDGQIPRRNRIARGRRGELTQEEDIAEGLAEIEEGRQASPWERYSILQSDDGVYYADRISPKDVSRMRAGKLKPPVYPFFAPRGGGSNQETGEGYYFSVTGQKFNGRYGASGALVRRRRGRFGEYEYLMARRAPWMSSGGGQWSFPGGVHKDKDSSEIPMETAVTEFREEVGGDLEGLTPVYSYRDQRAPDWAYDTHVYEVGRRDLSDINVLDGENTEVQWFTANEIMGLNKNGELLHSFGLVAPEIFTNSGDDSLIQREPGGLGRMFGKLRGGQRESGEMALMSTRSSRPLSPAEDRRLAVKAVDLSQRFEALIKKMRDERIAKNAALLNIVDDITKLVDGGSLTKNELETIRHISARADNPLYSPSLTRDVLLIRLQQDILQVSRERELTEDETNLLSIISNQIERKFKDTEPTRRSLEVRPLQMEFITPEEFADSGFAGAWLYPDGTVYPVINEHADEHDIINSFDDGIVRLRLSHENLTRYRDERQMSQWNQIKPYMGVEYGTRQFTDEQLQALERIYVRRKAGILSYSIHDEEEMDFARRTGQMKIAKKDKAVTLGVLDARERSAVGDTIRGQMGDASPPVPRSEGYAYVSTRSSSSINLSEPDMGSDGDIEDVATESGLMSTRSRRGKNRKKWNVTGDKKVTGDMKKLTPEQVRLEQEQKRRAARIPGKRKDGPSSREWLNVTRSAVAPGANAKEQYINSLSATRAGGELKVIGRPLSSQNANGTVSYISFGGDIKPGDILPNNFMQSLGSQGESRYSVASVQRMRDGVSKLALRDLMTGKAIASVISDDQQILDANRPASTRSGRVKIPAVWRDTVEDFRAGLTDAIVMRVRNAMQEREDVGNELSQLDAQFDANNQEWPTSEMEYRAEFLDDARLAITREVEEILAAVQHLVREERQAALTAASFKKAKKRASIYEDRTEKFELEPEDWADVLSLLEYDPTLERALFDTGPQGMSRQVGMNRTSASQLADELNELTEYIGYIETLEVDSIINGRDIDEEDSSFIDRSASEILENAILSVRRKKKLADAKKAIINTTATELDERAVLAISPSTRSVASPRITSKATVKMGNDLRNSEQLFPGRASKFSNSNVSFVAYDGNRNELIVGRDGGIYRYGGMNDDIIDTFTKSRKPIDASINQLDKDSSYTVSPDGSRRGLVPGLAQLLERDARRVKLSSAETSTIKNLAKAYSASSADEIVPIDPIRAHSIAKKLFANQEAAAAINIIDALEDSRSARLLPEGIAPMYRGLPKTPASNISIVVDNNDAGIVREELADLKKRFANNREVTSALDVYDKLIAAGQSGGLKTAFSMSPAEYEFIRDGVRTLRSSNMSNGAASIALLDHAASSPKLKFDATNFPQTNGTDVGSLFNSGAPYSLNKERRQELLDWAKESNMKVAQSLADEKFKTIATWKSLEALREFSTPTRSAVGPSAAKKGSKEVGTPFAEMAPPDYADMAPLDKLSWIKENIVQEGGNKGLRRDEGIKQAKEIMDAVNVIQDNLNRRENYENVIYGNGSGTAATPNFAKSWSSLSTGTRSILDDESRSVYSNDFRNLNNSQAADIVRRLRPEADKRRTGVYEIPENDLSLIWDDVMTSSQQLLDAIDKRRELGLEDEVLDVPRVPARESRVQPPKAPGLGGMQLPISISGPEKTTQTRTPDSPSNPTAAKVRRQRIASGISDAVKEYQDKLDSVYSNRYEDNRHSQVWKDIDKLFAGDNGAGVDFGIGNIDDAIDILDDYLTSDFAMDAVDGKPNGFAPRASVIAKQYVQESIERASGTRDYLNKLRNELMTDEFINKTPGRGASLVRTMPEVDTPPQTRYVPKIRGRTIDSYFAARKNELLLSTRSTRSSVKEGRAEIRAERTKFNELLNSLDREISKADDPRHVAALKTLKTTLTRQKSGKLSDKRTNAGALYLTQDEIDDIIEALYVALDRQVERGSEARTALFGEMAELMAKAAMATFINKTSEPVNSRTVTKINENGEEVEIALND